MVSSHALNDCCRANRDSMSVATSCTQSGCCPPVVVHLAHPGRTRTPQRLSTFVRLVQQRTKVIGGARCARRTPLSCIRSLRCSQRGSSTRLPTSRASACTLRKAASAGHTPADADAQRQLEPPHAPLLPTRRHQSLAPLSPPSCASRTPGCAGCT